MRLALRNDGRLRTLESGLVLFAVLAWHTEPLLLGLVVLVVLAQAAARRLLREWEAAALAPWESETERRRAERRHVGRDAIRSRCCRTDTRSRKS